MRYYPRMELRASFWAVSFMVLFAACGGSPTSSNAAIACGDPATACGMSCVDLQTDPANCGDCGTICKGAHAEHAVCLAGACAYDSCLDGFADCDGDATNGCELATTSDVKNCGGCGVACAPVHTGKATCTAGVCSHGTCATGYADCDNDATNGCEAPLATDNSNCGACGNACPIDSKCVAGVCTLQCSAPTAKCGSGSSAICTVLADDPNNCGTCGKVCAPIHADNAACSMGVCGYHKCAATWGDCDGNPANGCETCLICDTSNCGGCGFKCEAVHTTDLACNGTCNWTTCTTGWANCDANAGNGCETADSNTTCGTSCTNCTLSGKTCVSGSCV